MTFEQHPNDLKTLRFLLERQMEILDAAGATGKWPLPVEETSFSAHLMGT